MMCPHCNYRKVLVLWLGAVRIVRPCVCQQLMLRRSNQTLTVGAGEVCYTKRVVERDGNTTNARLGVTMGNMVQWKKCCLLFTERLPIEARHPWAATSTFF